MIDSTARLTRPKDGCAFGSQTTLDPGMQAKMVITTGSQTFPTRYRR
jgi:hypothetical protein